MRRFANERIRQRLSLDKLIEVKVLKFAPPFSVKFVMLAGLTRVLHVSSGKLHRRAHACLWRRC